MQRNNCGILPHIDFAMLLKKISNQVYYTLSIIQVNDVLL